MIFHLYRYKRSLCKFKPVIFFLSVFILPSAGNSLQQDISRDAYVDASIGDARVLIPVYADDSVSGGICGLIYNGLTKVDKDLNIAGDLAERWDVSDDGLVITFYLRKGVKWHDGEPFTSKDVKFTFETIKDPATGSPYISGFSDIRSIRAIDPYTVQFEYSAPYAPALLKLGMGIIPEHIFADIKDIRRSEYARAPVGTGPYMFSEWESEKFIILKANPEYFMRVPGIKRYVCKILPDQSVQYLELVSGEIDSMTLTPYQYKYRSDIKEFRERINKYRYLTPSYTYLGYNMKDPVLSDLRVRRALSRAVNKKEIIDAALLGLGEPCTGHFWKDSVYYNHEVDLYGYDPGEAVRLLAQAGWKDTDGDGVLDKDGLVLSLKIVTNQGNKVREDVATIVQRQWADIGVKAEIQVVAWASFIDQIIDKKKFQVILLAWMLPLDPDCYSVWHSDSIREGGLNAVSYSNPAVDLLIEKGRREFDIEKRKEVYHEIHRLIAEDAPYTFLYFSYRTPGINKRFRGIEESPVGLYHNFIDWHVPRDEVRYDF